MFTLFALLAVHFCAATGLVYGIDRLALIPWRKAPGAHWAERARLLWPARITSATLFFAAPISLGAAQASFFPTLPLTYLYAALAGIAGAVLGSWPMTKAMFPELLFGDWARSALTAFVIRLMTLGVLIAAGICMPEHLNQAAIVLTVTVVAFTLWLIWGGMLWLLRVARVLVAAPPRLAGIVTNVAAQMNLPLPHAGLLRGYGANAIAFPVTHTLLVTERALNSLSDDELAAVCAHEFAHLNEPRGVILARILSAFVLLPGIFFKPAIEAWQTAGYLGICVALFLFPRLTTAFRRRMEARADSVALVHEGPSPGTYARALEQLYALNHSPAVLRGRLTHPNLYDRLLAAGVTPEYPRPAAPPRLTWHYGMVLLLLAASGFGIFCRIELDRQKESDAAQTGEEEDAK